MNNNDRCFYLEIDGSCQCYHTALSNLNQIYYCKDIINCYYKQLIQLKANNDQLTQKLEKAREYLNAIVNGTHFTEDLSGHLIELAQQALKELE